MRYLTYRLDSNEGAETLMFLASRSTVTFSRFLAPLLRIVILSVKYFSKTATSTIPSLAGAEPLTINVRGFLAPPFLAIFLTVYTTTLVMKNGGEAYLGRHCTMHTPHCTPDTDAPLYANLLSRLGSEGHYREHCNVRGDAVAYMSMIETEFVDIRFGSA